MGFWLVVEPTHLKNMLVKMGFIFPKFWGEDKKCLKPPPSFLSDNFPVDFDHLQPTETENAASPPTTIGLPPLTAPAIPPQMMT